MPRANTSKKNRLTLREHNATNSKKGLQLREPFKSILDEHNRGQRSKRQTNRPSDFKSRKEAIYAIARDKAKSTMRLGVTALEDAQYKIRNLKAQEAPYEGNLNSLEQLIQVQAETAHTLMSTYTSFLEDVAPRRSAQIDAASAMIQTNLGRRRAALNKFSMNARAKVEEVREYEKTATDASNLIKHYKGLLYG